MMDYTDYSVMDPILMPWARKRGVHIYMLHQDCDVRLISIAEPSGQQRQMSIDPIDDNRQVRIRASRFDGWRLDRSVSLAELANVLDEVYDAMMGAGGSSLR